MHRVSENQRVSLSLVSRTSRRSFRFFDDKSRENKRLLENISLRGSPGEKREREGKNKRRNNDSRLILGRNLLRRNLISRLTKEFHYAESKTLSIFVSASSSRENSPRKREERPKVRRRWPRDTRYTARTCVRTPTSGRGGPRTCVRSHVPTFIHSNTHRPRCTPQREREKEGGGGGSTAGRGTGRRQRGNTESRRDGKISGGSKETAGGDREPGERERQGGVPRAAPRRRPAPSFFSTERGTSRRFSARGFHTDERLAARILARGCVRPSMI